MEFEKIIRERTAVRKFKSEQITDEQLNKILEAGRIAPTAKNQQPQKIFVVQTPENLAKIDEVSPCRYNAPTVLLVCSDKSVAFHKEGYSSYEMDACIVATHMMLEATNVGVDNIWVKMLDEKKTKEIFNLCENIEPVCLIPLGYKDESYQGNPMHTVRKELSETVIYL